MLFESFVKLGTVVLCYSMYMGETLSKTDVYNSNFTQGEKKTVTHSGDYAVVEAHRAKRFNQRRLGQSTLSLRSTSLMYDSRREAILTSENTLMRALEGWRSQLSSLF